MPPIRLALLALLILPGITYAGPATDGEPARPSPPDLLTAALRDPGFPAAITATHRLPPLEPERLEALQKRNRTVGTKPFLIGLHRTLDAPIDAASLTWRPLPTGAHAARVSVTSPDAAALRLALDIVELPPGTEVRAAAPGEPAATAITAAAWPGGPLHWTPVTEGDTQVLELTLPPGQPPASARFTIVTASHLVASPFRPLPPKIGGADWCQYDATCLQPTTQAETNARQATTRMVFPTALGEALCTGTLLNDTEPSTQIPYLFSAAHCLRSQSAANALTTFWFYEASACDAGDLDAARVRQVAGGAAVLHADTPSDVLLLRLNAPPPAGAHFLGWDAAPLAAHTDVLVLHHPVGDVMKASLGRATGTGASSLRSGSFNKVAYTHGSTQTGSSGAGLLSFGSAQYRLRGALLGGSASCETSGSLTTPGNSDDYSRLDLAFNALRTYLQPDGSPPPDANYSGAWSNPAQDGWGVNVIRGDSGAYALFIYHYDLDASPAWYLSSGTVEGTRYTASLLAFTGPGFGSPFAPSAVSSRAAGTVTVDFTALDTATFTATIDGRRVSTTLSRLAF
jgi:lysyl endopeptidase